MERIKIGVLYQNMPNWMGGTYYIQNLISALNNLEDHKKPDVIIYCKTDEEYDQINKFGYSYMSKRDLSYTIIRLSFIKRILNKLNNKLTGFDIYPQQFKLETEDIHSFFPTPVGLQLKSNQKCIYWVPDFQERYYPNYFSEKEVQDRTQSHRFIAKSKDTVIFSSENAENDFNKFFPEYKCTTKVMRFAVTHPDINSQDISNLKSKYGIEANYYISPNQFWAHKNQTIVISAAGLLKENGKLDFEIVFTGKEEDYRNPDYAEGLKKKVLELGLEKHVKFLGFIDRADQLALMKNSIAVIQPSLFEGWSTVVEDAKALNQYVVVSDLPIHREQLEKNVSFFPADNEQVLADILINGIENGFSKEPFEYKNAINQFAADFIKIVHD